MLLLKRLSCEAKKAVQVRPYLEALVFPRKQHVVVVVEGLFLHREKRTMRAGKLHRKQHIFIDGRLQCICSRTTLISRIGWWKCA